MGFPGPGEAASYYSTYIDRVSGGDIVDVIESQVQDTRALFDGISEEKSLHRYAPEKWSIRQVLNHVNDTERVFAFRAFWFARGFADPLPSFDQNIGAGAARADEYPWAKHVQEFQQIRQATLSLFRNLPVEAWMRSGIASGNSVTVNALAYIIAGHVAHHVAILRERYL
ncbi:MAG TPA: DinB family protein [Candidatus Acidoferrales bacterium]|nr:DinB family protein [Candidatus Acidoferrales bacterium]